MYRAQEIEYQANHCEAKLIIAESTLVDCVEAIRSSLSYAKHFIVSYLNGIKKGHISEWESFDDLISANSEAEPEIEIQDNDPALLVCTSGTEAKPKEVLIPHRNYFSSTALSFFLNLRMRREEVYLFMMPFYAVGIGTFTALSIGGATMVLIYQVDSSLALRVIEKERVTFCTQTPTFFLKLMQDPHIRPRYGSIGLSQFGNECRIVDLETGADLPIGGEGELVIKGPAIMKGYWKQPKATTEVLKNGWLFTGDIARMDEDGFFYIVGREKELIKASGFSVFPAEVESFFYGHPAVREVAVIGVPDPYRGENIKAIIVLNPEYEGKITEEEVIEWSRAKMAVYKYPRIVEFVKELPKTGSGKVLKRLLK